MRTRVRRHVQRLGVAAALVAGALVADDTGIGDPWTVAALAVANIVAERSGVWVTRTTQLSIALLPTLFAAVLFGPLAGAVVNAASMLGDPELLAARDPERAPRMKVAAYTCSRFITGAAAGLAATAMTGWVGWHLAGLLATTLVAALVAEGLDVCFAAAAGRARRGEAAPVLRALGPLLLTSVPAYAPLVAVLALSYREVSPWTAPLFFVPALAAQRLFGMVQHQRELVDRLEDANVSFAVALVATLEASDAYTAGHSRAVAIYSRDIAVRMELPLEEHERVFRCGLVHDIGKVGLPATLLGKEGTLTLEERRVMQRHSEIGERILAEIAGYEDVARIVRHHHERVDGEGYPDRIRGEEIPLLSRVIAVADAYNAMTSSRPYRDALPSRVARLRLAQAVETQFDTAVVAAFEAILAGADEVYRTATGPEFEPSAPAVGVARPASPPELVAVGA